MFCRFRRFRLGRHYYCLGLGFGLVILVFFTRPVSQISEVSENQVDIVDVEDIDDKLILPVNLDSVLPYKVENQSIKPRSIKRRYQHPPKSMYNQKASPDKILARMEKSMNKEASKAQVNIESLPKPKAILEGSIGPAKRLDKITTGRNITRGAKLVFISRSRTGFPVIEQFLTGQNGFFEHGEPSADSDLITNLLNCVLGPEMIDVFQSQVKDTHFGMSRYFREDCLLTSGTTCTDPLSYETNCAKYTHQFVRMRSLNMNSTVKLLQTNPDIKMVMLVRDPRGTLAKPGNKQTSEAEELCKLVSQEMDMSVKLLGMFPNQFMLARYELLATQPELEVMNLFSKLGVELSSKLSAVNSSGGVWNKTRNSVESVNSWKQRLSMIELAKVENKCVDTLSKLEYQLLSQGVK